MPTADGTSDAQLSLDDVVTRVAVSFMQVSARTIQDVLERTLRELVTFFDVDTSFLRRNDLERNVSHLVAEWPQRLDVPDPDPLGTVPFGVDPVFDASMVLAEPFVMRPTQLDDGYQERVQQGAGVGQVSMAMVPLLRDGTTEGVLGFVKFGDRPWQAGETNALQAVASLLVQLLARVGAEQSRDEHALRDELTGLPNRRAFLQELAHRSDPAEARGAPAGLLVVDLDRFTTINDALGHGAGDRLLVAVAERLGALAGPEDFVARLAGDEFAVLLGRGHADAAGFAEAALADIALPIEVRGHEITRTGSAGLALVDEDCGSGEELLTRADAALRRAKAQGGNLAVVFDRRLREAVRERSDTEVQLREAIAGTGLQLHYQPEVDLRTGRLVAVEALIRWQHPQRGLLSAGTFIGVAEETGLIVDLGQWVMAEACRQLAAWRVEHPDLLVTMRVNMSPAQLATRNMVALVRGCLERNGLPGRLLCFEITEHAVMQDVEQAVETLLELRALGVSLAIDDFGTGFSSMAQLKRLPVDTLKIDQTFVAGLGIDGGDRAIVDASIRLARAFGLDVVAEGVEAPGLVQELLALGCHRAQGYLLCVPSPAAELVPLLARGGLADDHPAMLARGVGPRRGAVRPGAGPHAADPGDERRLRRAAGATPSPGGGRGRPSIRP